MSRAWKIRVVLVFALVFSQTLLAQHSVLHGTAQTDCHICLLASPASTPMAGSETPQLVAPELSCADRYRYHTLALSSRSKRADYCRGPPLHLL